MISLLARKKFLTTNLKKHTRVISTFRVSNKKYFIMLFFTGFYLANITPSFAEKVSNICKITVTPIKYLSILSMSKLSRAINLDGKFGTLTYQAFDAEDSPVSGNRAAVGFILARSSDIGGATFGAVVWANGDASIFANKNKRGEILIESGVSSPCRARSILTFSGKGEIKFDGRTIGSID